MWAIGVRWAEARSMPRAERRVLLWTLALTRGVGLLLGVFLVAVAVVRSLQ